jgi:hypothetical protein
MALEDVLRTLRARMPWPVAQKGMKSVDLPVGQGWQKTETKLFDEIDDIDDATDALTGILRQNILCGEKIVRFYELGDEEIDNLRRRIIATDIADDAFSQAYPAILEDEALADEGYMEPRLVAIEQNRNGMGAVFSGVRTIEIREPVQPVSLPADMRLRYHEVFGIRRIKTQFMDVLWIPNEGNLIEARIDSLDGVRQEDAFGAHEKFKSIISTIAHQTLPDAVNLFPLIQLMYLAVGEGTVVELAFFTNTASLKHEKMRKRDRCLRAEPYHVGGKRAVRELINPFKLSIEWTLRMQNDVEGRPELGLHSTARMAGSPVPNLTEALINSCPDQRAYEHVRSRIEQYL